MAASFGEELRVAREARGVTLRQISDDTHIPMRYLEAIENNDYKPLPGGIFNRSFIKKYASYIGFDEEKALEGYSRTAREQGTSPDEVNTTPHVPNVYTESGSNRSPLVTLVLMALILGILSLGIYAGLHWYQRRFGGEGGKPVQAITTAPATQSNPAIQSNSTTPVAAQPGPSPAQTIQAVAPSGEFKIQIKAVGLPVWVETTVDAAKPISATLQPGDTRDFAPSASLGLKLAKINTNALQVTINGREAKITYDTSGKNVSAEAIIARDSYAKYLQ